MAAKPSRFVFPLRRALGAANAPTFTHEVLTVDLNHRTLAVYLAASYGSADPTHSGGKTFTLIETANSHAVPLVEASLKNAYNSTFEAVRWIVVTHAHLDHCAGAGQFLARCPNATVLCHPAAKKHLVDPSALLRSAARVYDAETMKRSVGEMIPCPAERVRAVEDGEVVELHEGRHFQFLHTLGHAKHHIVAVDRSSNSVFSGDSFGMSCDCAGLPNVFIPLTAPIDFDYFQQVQSVKRIVGLNPSRVFPTHFGCCDAPVAAAEQLIAQLEQYERVRCLASVLLQREIDPEEVVAAVQKELRRLLDQFLASRGHTPSADPENFVDLNMLVNAQGLAFAASRNPVSLTQVPPCLAPLLKPASRFDSPLEAAAALGLRGVDATRVAEALQKGAQRNHEPAPPGSHL